MPYVCRDCEYFDGDVANASTCPCCGGAMRFTMLGQQPTATATLEPPKQEAWKDPYQYGYEEIEASWECRYAQIGVGISTYFFVWRWGPRLLTLLVGGDLTKLPKEKLVAFAIAVLIVNCIGAFSGGVAAGFWARNWVVQGLGVAVGVLAIPIVGMLFLMPESWPLFAIMLAATSVLTLAGAFVGHLFVKPTRIPIS